MLVNHLVLNLHTFDPRGSTSTNSLSDQHFAEDKFLGPIGAPLEVNGEGASCDDWSEIGEDGHCAEGSFSDRLSVLTRDSAVRSAQ